MGTNRLGQTMSKIILLLLIAHLNGMPDNVRFANRVASEEMVNTITQLADHVDVGVKCWEDYTCATTTPEPLVP